MIEDTALEILNRHFELYANQESSFQYLVQPLQVTGRIRGNIKMPLYRVTFKPNLQKIEL